MRNLSIIASLIIMFAFSAYCQTKKDGTPDKRYNSNKQSPSYTSTSTSSNKSNNSRPTYSGQTHTTSHEGTYVGEQNSKTHKGGTYKNSKSNNKYGIHKTK